MKHTTDEVSFKLLIIGDPGVGKTSLVWRICEDKFVAGLKPTQGVDFAVKALKLKDFEEFVNNQQQKSHSKESRNTTTCSSEARLCSSDERKGSEHYDRKVDAAGSGGTEESPASAMYVRDTTLSTTTTACSKSSCPHREETAESEVTSQCQVSEAFPPATITTTTASDGAQQPQEDVSSGLLSTLSSNFFTRTYDVPELFRENHSANVALHIWDVSGQERTRNMTRVFYKNASAAVIVCDVSRGDTLEGALQWKNDLDAKYSSTLPTTTTTVSAPAASGGVNGKGASHLAGSATPTPTSSANQSPSVTPLIVDSPTTHSPSGLLLSPTENCNTLPIRRKSSGLSSADTSQRTYIDPPIPRGTSAIPTFLLVNKVDLDPSTHHIHEQEIANFAYVCGFRQWGFVSAKKAIGTTRAIMEVASLLLELRERKNTTLTEEEKAQQQQTSRNNNKALYIDGEKKKKKKEGSCGCSGTS